MFKHASDSDTVWAEALGILALAAGTIIIPWSAHRYEALHRVLRSGAEINDPRLLGSLAIVTIALSAGALLLVILNAVPT